MARDPSFLSLSLCGHLPHEENHRKSTRRCSSFSKSDKTEDELNAGFRPSHGICRIDVNDVAGDEWIVRLPCSKGASQSVKGFVAAGGTLGLAAVF
jgi:hypothetical protein